MVALGWPDVPLTRDPRRETIQAMRRLVAAALVAALGSLGLAASAGSQAWSYTGQVSVGINGWGSVKLSKGLAEHQTVTCTNPSCPAYGYFLRGSHVVLSETPYKGWKFTHWNGACKAKTATCLINVAKFHPNSYGEYNIHVGATFIPVAPGLTFAHPLPVGTQANIGQGLIVRVNSATPNVQLTPPAPAGAEYFAANVTVTYTGGGSQEPDYFGFSVKGSHNTTYTTGLHPCPYPGPQPPLDVYDPLFSGQSATGNVCWTIAANDESSLELYFGSGTLSAPATTWFALR
jgi:hypothetical protein